MAFGPLPYHVLFQDLGKLFVPVLQALAGGQGIAGDGHILVGYPGYVALKPQLLVIYVVTGLVILKTRGIEQNPQALPAWGALSVAVHHAHNVLCHRGEGPGLVYAVVDVQGSQFPKNAHAQAPVLGQGRKGGVEVREGAGVGGLCPPACFGVVGYLCTLAL